MALKASLYTVYGLEFAARTGSWGWFSLFSGETTILQLIPELVTDFGHVSLKLRGNSRLILDSAKGTPTPRSRFSIV